MSFYRDPTLSSKLSIYFWSSTFFSSQMLTIYFIELSSKNAEEFRLELSWLWFIKVGWYFVYISEIFIISSLILPSSPMNIFNVLFSAFNNYLDCFSRILRDSDCWKTLSISLLNLINFFYLFALSYLYFCYFNNSI